MNNISEPRTDFTRYGLIDRAAYYFFLARKPRDEWKGINDISAQLAEFDLRCASNDYNNAANVLREIGQDYLLLWGHYRLLIDLFSRIREKITNKDLLLNSLNILGLAYNYTGKTKESLLCFQQGLDLARDIKNRLWEGAFINNLGLSYSKLGDIRKAMEFHEYSLVISREIGDRHSEGNILGNLGFAYADLGDNHKAIELHERALTIVREIGDRQSESIEVENTGDIFLSLNEPQKAKAAYQQAIQIASEISFPVVELNARWGLAQVYLLQNDLANARATIEAALQYDVPQNNHNASALHGIIALLQRDEVAARGAFVRAIGQADEILSKTAEYYSALDAKGLAICGLILAGRGDPSMPTETNDDKTVPPDKSTVSAGRVAPTIDDAIETFRKARKIAPHAGVVKSVLRLFDELVKCDEEGVLKDVRKVIDSSVVE
jgi:tetratricopeptide (TPR) repeat protein